MTLFKQHKGSLKALNFPFMKIIYVTLKPEYEVSTSSRESSLLAHKNKQRDAERKREENRKKKFEIKYVLRM